MTTILASLITGLLALIGVVITNASANKRMTSEIHTAQAVSDTKIEELTREVRVHNRFAERMPVVEEKVGSLEKRVGNLENKKNEGD